MADYNVTCPDFRFCEVKHTYMNPCEIWDCGACWWGYDNCTKTPEAPSDHCPYIKRCTDLPHPHSHTTVTIVTVVSVLSALAVGARYIYRRFRRTQESVADPEVQAEDEEERIPLLQRCRDLLSRGNSNNNSNNQPSRLDRFRAVIFGGRATAAPPEVPTLQDREDHEPSAPSAPPPSYDDINNDPIIREGSLANENYAPANPCPVEMRVIGPSPSRSIRRLDEVPLSQSAR